MRYVESLNKSLHYLMQNDEYVIILGEDIIDPYGGAFKVTKGLSTMFPDRVLATPISEAAITGFSTGLAIRGFKPIVEIMFGDFITLIADQLINGISKFQWMYSGDFSIPIVIRTPMGGRRGYGPTHSQTLETLFLGVPGINIIAPSNYHNPGKLLKNIVLDSLTPTLFIENKLLYPMKIKLPQKDDRIDEFFITEIINYDKKFPSVSLRLDNIQDPDVTLIAYGGMAPLAVDAAMNLLMDEEILVEIIIPSIIKPIPLEDILPSSLKSGRIIIVEEAIKISGWGSELACQLTENIFSNLKKPIMRLGSRDCPIPSSKSQEYNVLPQSKDIEIIVKELLQ